MIRKPMKNYDFKKVEAKWQKCWLEDKVFRANDKSKKPKYYQLETFPYPSGEGLHVGHPKGYIAEDIHARYMRMRGKEVLYTIGWDAFGLPTENYAIKVGKAPKEVAEANVKNFKRQVQMFGLSYDWDREINTSDPGYYKWTQWLFIQLFKKGLAYKAKAKVNWCPSCLTVLANEQVKQVSDIPDKKSEISNGAGKYQVSGVTSNVCERCGAEVEQKEMEQWFLKITDYAERLLKDLRGLDPIRNNSSQDPSRACSSADEISNGVNWPEATKKRQEDWIGKSEGAEIEFPIKFKKSRTFLYLHGYSSSPDRPRHYWYRQELEKLGHRVIIPELPNSNNPTEEEQVRATLGAFEFNEDTILVGHSLGGLVAMKALMKSGKKIAGLVLIAPAIDPSFPNTPKKPFHKTFQWDIDYKKIRNLTQYRVVISDLQETNRAPYLRELSTKLDARLVEVVAAKEHFRGDKEPEVLRQLIPIIKTFTTRPDTLFGATYLVFSPEHKEISNLKSQITNWEEVEKYIEKAKNKKELDRISETKDKTGVELKGVKAINPATKKEIPIWVADYVLGSYGTGAIMAVPAHDGRDFEFATRYKLFIKNVIAPLANANNNADPRGELKQVYMGEGNLLNSGKFDGMDSEKAKWEITKFVEGKKKVQYKLRDWLVSRQRYWGVPIPMINCKECGVVPVPEKDLPVLLPDLKDYRPKGMPPLESSDKFIDVKCPKCKGPARREAETLDTFVDSSWYYLRYTDPHNDKKPFDKLKVNHWMPVDLYIIGAEHTVLHLLYSRFITKFLKDEGYLGFEEPFLKLRHVGLIQGSDGQKMSKSRGNVVNPDDLVSRVGADTVRVYEMFMGPFEQGQPWDTQGVLGVERFLQRALKLFAKLDVGSKKLDVKDGDFERLLHKTIKKVSEDIKGLNFNTAISALMILLNEMEKVEKLSVESYELFVKLLYPFAPHMCEEIWHEVLKHNTYLHNEKWPTYDEKKLVENTFVLVVQVNGKVRDSFEAEAGISQEEAEKLVLAREKVQAHLKGEKPKKVIYVPGRLVNLVV